MIFERQAGETPFNAVKKTCDATGVSKSIVVNIRNEAEAGELKSPGTVPRNRAVWKTLVSRLVPAEKLFRTCIYR